MYNFLSPRLHIQLQTCSCHVHIAFGRSVVNLHANHHYSSFAALNAVIQAEFSLHQRPGRSSSSSVDLSPIGDSKDQYLWQPRSSSLSSDVSPSVEMRDHPGRLPRTSRSSSEQTHGSDSKDTTHHERDSSSASSVYSPRSSNTLPLQKKILTHSDPRYRKRCPLLCYVVHKTYLFFPLILLYFSVQV